MALWVCGGEAGCGTKYAVGLSRCPRCHNTAFHEDGDPMAKITRHGGASDATLPTPDAVVRTEDRLSKEQIEELREAVEAGAEPLPFGATVHPVAPEEEGGDGPSLGSSSSASTETQQQKPEPSGQPTLSPARTTGSRSKKAATVKASSARGTGGGQETGTSETGSADE